MKIFVFVFLLIAPCHAQDVFHHGTRPVDFDRPQIPTDASAALLEPLEVIYPDSAMRRGWEGVAIIAAWIDRRGDVAYAELAESSGHAMLDSVALTAVLSGYFKAAQRDGQPVASRMSIPVEFRLRRDVDAYDAVKSGEELQQEADELSRAKEMLEEEQRRIDEEIRRLKEQQKKDATKDTK
ncbi:MAG: TonB family protein [Bacteroidetes bacterium]|nr:TonB family protein [Bacteroidota bacterium]